MPNVFKHIVGMSAEHVSTRVLYALVAVTVVVFVLFFAIGYDEPYADDPSFNAPLFTDAVLVFIYLLVLVAVAVAITSLVRAVRQRDDSSDIVNNLPATKIKYCSFGLLAVLLVVTFALGSTEPVLANGVKFTDALWLRITDMFINTSIVLLIVAAAGVAFGLSGRSRKLNLKHQKPKAGMEK